MQLQHPPTITTLPYMVCTCIILDREEIVEIVVFLEKVLVKLKKIKSSYSDLKRDLIFHYFHYFLSNDTTSTTHVELCRYGVWM